MVLSFVHQRLRTAPVRSLLPGPQRNLLQIDEVVNCRGAVFEILNGQEIIVAAL